MIRNVAVERKALAVCINQHGASGCAFVCVMFKGLVIGMGADSTEVTVHRQERGTATSFRINERMRVRGGARSRRSSPEDEPVPGP
jgi:hypothetical protein